MEQSQSDKSTDEVLDKLKKILARSESSNQHEAELALSKAHELMTRYNIKLQDVKGHQLEEDKLVELSKYTRLFRLSLVVKLTANLVQKFFHVAVLYKWYDDPKVGSARTVTLIGQKHNVDIAGYIYEHVHNTAKQLYSDYLKRNDYAHNKTIQNSYYKGLFQGLAGRLAAQQRTYQEQGLVLVRDPRLEEATSGLKGIGKAKGMLYSDVIQDGRADSVKVNLNPAITESEQTLKITGGIDK